MSGVTLTTTGPRTFEAMGCEIVVAGADDRELAEIRLQFASRDATFSRFRDDSELSAVNRSTSSLVAVSPLFAAAVAHALRVAAATRGLVDPTVGAAVEAAGYDRDFDEVLAGARGILHPASPCGRWREVVIEDYIHGHATKLILLLLVKASGFVLGTAGLVAMLIIAIYGG